MFNLTLSNRGEPSILDQRITYGETAEIGEFPWQAAIFIGKSFHCGGSIISEHFILTAAHCVIVYQNTPEQLRVVLGVWNIVNSSEEGAQTYRVRTGIDSTGKLAFITGWGRDQRKRLVSRLHKLQSAIVSNGLCDDRWRENGAPKGFIVPSMICMDAQNGDSCNGDSGGPSVIEHPQSSGFYTQVGIVSFGSGSCTEKKLPGVYTNVAYYLDWINKEMNR
ncbi:Tryptase beta-2 [Armadillidium nasatum]|uniref:Tryptase beta-2 n=1 Tax=Armadillidium nasatum TaxID=96803 RepID=A0A5N5SSM7_9CRUS|nr:Tryptase beta-2 [Armadillidium nasatum]